MIEVAYANHPRSISRLHDDELACVLPFLALKQLARLVRCSRRFNAVVRKERSRGLHWRGGANIAQGPSSSLRHHISSLHLDRTFNRNTMVTRDTLQRLHGLPRLTSLQLTLYEDAIGHLFAGLSPETAAAALRAVLPTQLRSFSAIAGSQYSPLDSHSADLVSSFWGALENITQLTELNIEQYSSSMHVRPELAGLADLRKLTLGTAGERGEHVAALKQLSQLRELTLHDDSAERLRLLCQPPHALELESLTLTSLRLKVDEATMHALLHLPTLTALDPSCISDAAWPLLPQLPRLRRLHLYPTSPLTSEGVTSLCAALSRCSSLEDLTLCYLTFVAPSGVERADAQQKQAAWSALLSSVPKLRRLHLDGDMTSLLPLLPFHLPLLEHLLLNGFADGKEDHFARIAHPNLRILELGTINFVSPSDKQLHACKLSERLPKLERCRCMRSKRYA